MKRSEETALLGAVLGFSMTMAAVSGIAAHVRANQSIATYTLSDGRMATWSMLRSKCEEQSIHVGQTGYFVEVRSPWGDTFRVKAIRCD